MKQIYCRHPGLKTLTLMVLSLFFGCSGAQEPVENEPVYKIIGQEINGIGAEQVEWGRKQIETLGTEEIPSAYFDQALGYEGSTFRVVSLEKLVRRFDPDGLTDAILFNCFDDYQGILSVDDITRYHIRLATRIEILPQFEKPDWLNPLLLIIPDNKDVPKQERYLTANIRELKFTKLADYYAPLDKLADGASKQGLSAFKNNCLFCHSLLGIGGNKGARLLEGYDFSSFDERKRFRQDFAAFHHKDNPDKQGIDQFVSESELEFIWQFLGRAREAESGVMFP